MKKLIQISLGILSHILLTAYLLNPIGSGIIQGTVIDEQSGEAIPFANVVLLQYGQQVTGASTDFDGRYRIKSLQPGSYDVRVSVVGFQALEKKGVLIQADKSTIVDFKMVVGIKLNAVMCIEYKVPLVERSASQSRTVLGSSIRRMPSRGAASSITRTAGVQDNAGIGSIRGVRRGSTHTYIDGVRVRGSSSVPKAAVEQVSVLTGGIPARYETNGIGLSRSAKRRLHEERLGGALTIFAPGTGESGVNIFKRKKKKLQPEGLVAGYDLYRQQSFKNVFSKPLSTFSIDVDAASYSQIRRSINMGTLPHPDIVRIEEMVNYFKYDYPQPSGKDPFSITTEVTDCPWNPVHRLVHIGLQGKEMGMEGRPENNLVFLIDVSGSMSYQDKLPLLKKSLRLLVDQLNEKDHISIVVYAGAAGVVLPSTSGDKKERILAAIGSLTSGGSTAGGAGIQLAYSIAEKKFIKKGNNRIILCTDGDFNVGVSSNEGLEKLIEKKRDSGVFLTVLGFGTGNFQDEKMETLADKGNGNFAYIDNLQEAQKVLVQEFWGTLFTIAKDVKIQVEFNPLNVIAYRLIGYENRRLAAEDFNDDRKDAGELGAGHTVTALYEVILVGIDLSNQEPLVDSLKYQRTKPLLSNGLEDELLTIKLRYKKPDEDVSKLLIVPLSKESVSLEKSSDNMRFSAALSQFGMILLDKKLKASQRMDQIKRVIEMADKSKGKDEDGRRAEFVRLAQLAMIME